MAKKLYNDQFTSQYSHLSPIIYNGRGGKKLAIKPAFYKQTAQHPLANYVANKIQISSSKISSIYGKKKVDDSVDYGFGSKKSQMIFLRKVHLLVLLQLILTIPLQCVSILYRKPLAKACKEKKTNCDWIPLSFATFGLILFTCCRFHRRYPYNYIALIYFTCTSSVFLMKLTFKLDIIFYAIIIFTSSIIALMIFTCQTKFKYTIYTSLAIILICDIISFILLSNFKKRRGSWYPFIYSQMIANACLLFFVIDVQLMISKYHKYDIKANESIFATMTLYTDVANVFIYIWGRLNSNKF